MADPLIFVRGVHFAATLVACGTVGFVRLVAEPPSRLRFPAASRPADDFDSGWRSQWSFCQARPG